MPPVTATLLCFPSYLTCNLISFLIKKSSKNILITVLSSSDNLLKNIQLSGNNVTNSGTVFGERVAIDAKNDITNYGKLVGDKLVYLSADNDINLLSGTRTQIRGNNVTTNIDQASIIQVNNGNIVIDAGHDIDAKMVDISAGKQLELYNV